MNFKGKNCDAQQFQKLVVAYATTRRPEKIYAVGGEQRRNATLFAVQAPLCNDKNRPNDRHLNNSAPSFVNAKPLSGLAHLAAWLFQANRAHLRYSAFHASSLVSGHSHSTMVSWISNLRPLLLQDRLHEAEGGGPQAAPGAQRSRLRPSPGLQGQRLAAPRE